jgi:hypothetical protein
LCPDLDRGLGVLFIAVGVLSLAGVIHLKWSVSPLLRWRSNARSLAVFGTVSKDSILGQRGVVAQLGPWPQPLLKFDAWIADKIASAIRRGRSAIPRTSASRMRGSTSMTFVRTLTGAQSRNPQGHRNSTYFAITGLQIAADRCTRRNPGATARAVETCSAGKKRQAERSRDGYPVQP